MPFAIAADRGRRRAFFCFDASFAAITICYAFDVYAADIITLITLLIISPPYDFSLFHC